MLLEEDHRVGGWFSGIHFWTPEDLAGPVGRFEEFADFVQGVVAVENRIFD